MTHALENISIRSLKQHMIRHQAATRTFH